SSTGAFMVRWDRWKLVHYVDQPDQLFDLVNDPDELTDLASSPDAAPMMVEGLKRLHAICDPRAVNARAFADQAARIEALGGDTACREGFIFNHTPTPAEQAEMKATEGSAL
ncbi:MAG: choline-sulfatase, partial [Pseudomonadota bacterium]